MENIKRSVEDIIDDLKDYVDTGIELQKLKATEKAAQIASSVVINMLLAFAGGFALLFFSIAAAFLISHYLHQTWIGFVIVAGIYALLGAFIFATKDKWLKNRLINNFIQSIYSK